MPPEELPPGEFNRSFRFEIPILPLQMGWTKDHVDAVVAAVQSSYYTMQSVDAGAAGTHICRRRMTFTPNPNGSVSIMTEVLVCPGQCVEDGNGCNWVEVSYQQV